MGQGTSTPLIRNGDIMINPRGQDGNTNLPVNAVQLVGVAGNPLTLPLAQFFDTQNVSLTGAHRTLYIVVTSAITHSAGQATVRAYAGLQSFAGGSGASSQLPFTGSNADQALVGSAAVNLSTSNNSLPVGMYVFDTVGINILNQEYAWMGFEFNFSATVTGGAMAVYLMMASNGT